MNRYLIATSVALGLGLAWAGSASADDTERGKEVYAEQKCKLCHSIAGEGNKKGSLDDVGSRVSAEDMKAWHRDPAAMTQKAGAERKPQMKKYPPEKLSDEDLDALVAYLLTLKAG
jgi:mono/diheme cytochrome c family protein